MAADTLDNKAFAKLAIEAILPKGISLDVTYQGTEPILHFRVRYMYDGTRKNVGTFSNYRDALSALAAERVKEVYAAQPTNWREIIEQAIEALTQHAPAQDVKALAMQRMFGSKETSELAQAVQEEQQKLYDLIQYIAPHTLVRGKQTEYIDEDTGEVTKIPGHLVTKYLEVLEAELMRIKYAPSGEDIHGGVNHSTDNSAPETDTESKPEDF